MTFELVRWNWPNTAAILALATMPFVASIANRGPDTAGARVEAAAAICRAPAECPEVAATSSPDIIFE